MIEFYIKNSIGKCQGVLKWYIFLNKNRIVLYIFFKLVKLTNSKISMPSVDIVFEGLNIMKICV